MGRDAARDKKEATRKGDFLAGKYLLEERLGVGGMGEVYRAENMSLGRKVAIKILSADFVENEDDVLRFLREARAAAAVRHPNVVDVLDVSRDEDGTPFIVQELLSGDDLEKHAKHSGGRLTVAEVLEIMIPVADAIGAAHAQGLVHRDLKPANIFLARTGSRLEPKVLDFGAVLYETVGELSKEERRMLIGTPHYMAPEQIQAKGEVDARVDVWALGVIMFELLVGYTPFEADTAAAVMELVRTRPARTLREVLPDTPVELERVVRRCLLRDRSARYADGAALRTALLEVKRSLSPSSRMETSPEIEPVRVPPAAAIPRTDDDEPPRSKPRPLAPEKKKEEEPASEPSLPPVLFGAAAAPASEPEKPKEPEKPAAKKPEPPSPKPAPVAPAAAKKAAEAEADSDKSDNKKKDEPKAAHGPVAAAVLVPAVAAFVALRFAPGVTAPIGRAMRGESVVAAGVFAVLSLVTAAALTARAFHTRTRGLVVASVGAFALGIVMIIVTFAAGDPGENGPPGIAVVAPFVAPLVPLGLAALPLAEALDLWPRKYHRKPAVGFALLTALCVLVALVLSPLGAFRGP